MNNYHLIGIYAECVPDFLLAFSWAKKKTYFHHVYHKNPEDVLQIIAMVKLQAGGDLRDLNRKLQKELYLFYKNTRHIIEPTTRENKKKYNTKKPVFVCDKCKREKSEYPRKNVLTNMAICGACAQSVRRNNRRRNLERWTWKNATPEQRKYRNKAIARLFDLGFTVNKISHIVNTKNDVVTKVLNRNGVFFRKRRA